MYTVDSKISALKIKHQTSGDVYVLKAKQRYTNKTVSLTYGKVKNLSLKKVRNLAIADLGLLSQGIHPKEKERLDKAVRFTLGEAIEQMLAVKTLKASTKKCYQQTLQRNFSDWLSREMRSITRLDCIEKYKKIRKYVATNGRVQPKANPAGEPEAQKAMRTLSTVFSFFQEDTLANGQKLLPEGNPVLALRAKKVRPPLKRRKDYLNREERHKLLIWLQEQYNIAEYGHVGDLVISAQQIDYILILLCTGLRRNEPLSLTWNDVDFENEIFTVTETKNGQDISIPMTRRVRALLERRLNASYGDFVFSSPLFANRSASMAKVIEKASADSEVVFSAHTLRRTTTTILAEMGFHSEQIGRLLNHSAKNQTEHYNVVAASQLKGLVETLESVLFEDYLLPQPVDDTRP